MFPCLKRKRSLFNSVKGRPFKQRETCKYIRAIQGGGAELRFTTCSWEPGSQLLQQGYFIMFDVHFCKTCMMMQMSFGWKPCFLAQVGKDLTSPSMKNRRSKTECWFNYV